jgi:hypothetical protein
VIDGGVTTSMVTDEGETETGKGGGLPAAGVSVTDMLADT